MTKIARKKVSENSMGKMIEQLWRAFASLENKEEVRNFIHDILTHTEIQMLAKRLQIVIMLEEKHTYDQISKALNVSEATIMRIQNWRQAFGSGYHVVLERLLRKNKKNLRSRMSSRAAALRMWK